MKYKEQLEMIEDMIKYNNMLYKDDARMLVNAFLHIYIENLKLKRKQKKLDNLI